MTGDIKVKAGKPCSIPIMFRTYPGGKFTEGIVNGPVEKVVISESKG